MLRSAGRGPTSAAGNGNGNGTVTSVGLSLPQIFVVSGSPITTAGTLAGTAVNPAGLRFVGYNSAANDLDYFQLGQGLQLSGNTIQLGANAFANGTVTGVNISFANQSIFTVGAAVTANGNITANAVNPGGNRVVIFNNANGNVEYANLGGSLGLAGNTIRDYQWLSFTIFGDTETVVAGNFVKSFRIPKCNIRNDIAVPRIGMNVASNNGLVTYDLFVANASILSTKLTVDANELTSTTAANQCVLSATAIADDANLAVTVLGNGNNAVGTQLSFPVTFG